MRTTIAGADEDGLVARAEAALDKIRRGFVTKHERAGKMARRCPRPGGVSL